MPQCCLYFHYKECRGCLEPSPCPVSSSKPCRPAKTNIGSKLLNFPGPGAPRRSQSSACSPPFPGQGPGWGGADVSPCWGQPGQGKAAVGAGRCAASPQQACGECAARSAELKHLRGCTQLILPCVHPTHRPNLGTGWAWWWSRGEGQPRRAGTMVVSLPPYMCFIGLCKSKYSTRDLFLQGLRGGPGAVSSRARGAEQRLPRPVLDVSANSRLSAGLRVVY